MAQEDPFGVQPGALAGEDYQPPVDLDSPPVEDPRPAGPGYGGARDITDIQPGTLEGGDEDESDIGLTPEEEAHLALLMEETAPATEVIDPDVAAMKAAGPEAAGYPPTATWDEEHGGWLAPPLGEPEEAEAPVPGQGTEEPAAAAEEPAKEPEQPLTEEELAAKAKNAPRTYLILEQGTLDSDEPYWFKVGTVESRSHDAALRTYLREHEISWGEEDCWIVVNARDFRKFAPKPKVSFDLGEVDA